MNKEIQSPKGSKKVPGYVDIYATEDGRIYDVARDIYINKIHDGRYYKSYVKPARSPRGKHVFTHILVCLAFHGPMPKKYMVVGHIDGDKLNLHYKNLKWMTLSENLKHAYDTGARKPSNQHTKYK